MSVQPLAHPVPPEETRESPRPAGDPLSDALIYLAAHHGRALSRDALIGGLPILDDRLSVALFDRAARRAGLEVEAVRRALGDIPALVLPAVLVLRDGSTRILVEQAADPRKAKVVDPSAGPQAAPRMLGADAADYLGYAFLVRPLPSTDARAVAAGDLPRDHWFWSVVGRFWSNYS
ncbi:MAG TPA: type I secretion system permease/ATPase, partial [Xanthobacteraceae bacterium]|nr:type I secretion system permease/ATPase [Xanthobacteraceae bacterium]